MTNYAGRQSDWQDCKKGLANSLFLAVRQAVLAKPDGNGFTWVTKYKAGEIQMDHFCRNFLKISESHETK